MDIFPCMIAQLLLYKIYIKNVYLVKYNFVCLFVSKNENWWSSYLQVMHVCLMFASTNLSYWLAMSSYHLKTITTNNNNNVKLTSNFL